LRIGPEKGRGKRKTAEERRKKRERGGCQYTSEKLVRARLPGRTRVKAISTRSCSKNITHNRKKYY